MSLGLGVSHVHSQSLGELAAKEKAIREMFLFLAGEEKKHVKLLQDEIDREVNREM